MPFCLLVICNSFYKAQLEPCWHSGLKMQHNISMKKLDVGKKLKELRESKNLLQKDVAEVLGVARRSYTSYENNNRSMPIEFFVILADFYDISLDYFADRERY